MKKKVEFCHFKNIEYYVSFAVKSKSLILLK